MVRWLLGEADKKPTWDGACAVQLVGGGSRGSKVVTPYCERPCGTRGTDGGDLVPGAAGVAANGNREKSSVKKSINQNFFFIHCIYVSDGSWSRTS